MALTRKQKTALIESPTAARIRKLVDRHIELQGLMWDAADGRESEAHGRELALVSAALRELREAVGLD